MVRTIIGELPAPMEIFVLTAISRGRLNSLYALQKAAGLQPGNVATVIRNLMESGLLIRSESGKHGRRALALTEAGERFLLAEWKNCLDGHREMESVLRSVTVALWMGDLATAVDFLFRSAAARNRKQGPHELGKIATGFDPIDLHAEMRAVFENRRRAMEESVLDGFGRNLVAAGPQVLARESR